MIVIYFIFYLVYLLLLALLLFVHVKRFIFLQIPFFSFDCYLLQFKSRPSSLLAPPFLTAHRQLLLTVRYTLWRQQTIAKKNEISVTNIISAAPDDDVCGPAKDEVEKDVSHQQQNDGNEVVSYSSSFSSQQQEENGKNASSPSVDNLASSSHSNNDQDKKKEEEEKEEEEQPPQNENPSANTTTSSSPTNSGIIRNHGEKRPFDADARAVADLDDAACDKHGECNCKEEPEAKKVKSPNQQQQEQESTMSSSSPSCSHNKSMADEMADRDPKEKVILLPVQQDHPVDKQVGGHRGGAGDDNDQDKSPATASTATSEK